MTRYARDLPVTVERGRKIHVSDLRCQSLRNRRKGGGIYAKPLWGSVAPRSNLGLGARTWQAPAGRSRARFGHVPWRCRPSASQSRELTPSERERPTTCSRALRCRRTEDVGRRCASCGAGPREREETSRPMAAGSRGTGPRARPLGRRPGHGGARWAITRT